MTNDEIIAMAREAGLRHHIPFFSDSEVHVALARFAALVAQHEREACAKVIESYEESEWMYLFQDDCAAAIRVRGEEV